MGRDAILCVSTNHKTTTIFKINIMKTQIINWISNNENVTTAIFCTIVFSIIVAFIWGVAMIFKYANVVTLA